MASTRSVPRAVVVTLAAALAAQVSWHALRPAPSPAASALPPAPPMALLQLASLGEPEALARLLLLSLAAHDGQAGAALSLRALDYGRVVAWLERILALDPRARAPLAAASELYAAVPDPERVRTMLAFVERQFAADPARRWPWMAHAALMARHRLHDLPLARRYARELRERAPDAPAWARQMEAFVLEEMDEHEAARAVIGALLDSGTVTDPNELRFLARRLDRMRDETKGERRRTEPAAQSPPGL